MSKWDNWCRTPGHPPTCACAYKKDDPEWVRLWKASHKSLSEFTRTARVAA